MSLAHATNKTMVKQPLADNQLQVKVTVELSVEVQDNLTTYRGRHRTVQRINGIFRIWA